MKKINSNGFSFLIVIVAILVLGTLFMAGLLARKSSAPSQSNETLTVEKNVSPITTTRELEQNTKELDSVEIDKELNITELDTDVTLVL